MPRLRGGRPVACVRLGGSLTICPYRHAGSELRVWMVVRKCPAEREGFLSPLPSSGNYLGWRFRVGCGWSVSSIRV